MKKENKKTSSGIFIDTLKSINKYLTKNDNKVKNEELPKFNEEDYIKIDERKFKGIEGKKSVTYELYNDVIVIRYKHSKEFLVFKYSDIRKINGNVKFNTKIQKVKTVITAIIFSAIFLFSLSLPNDSLSFILIKLIGLGISGFAVVTIVSSLINRYNPKSMKSLEILVGRVISTPLIIKYVDEDFKELFVNQWEKSKTIPKAKKLIKEKILRIKPKKEYVSQPKRINSKEDNIVENYGLTSLYSDNSPSHTDSSSSSSISYGSDRGCSGGGGF